MSTDIGTEAPTFTLPDTDGTEHGVGGSEMPARRSSSSPATTARTPWRGTTASPPWPRTTPTSRSSP